MTDAYPLQWPAGWPRSAEHRSPVFKVSLSEALDHLYTELERLGADGVVVSSSMQTRLDGRPLAKSRVPEDPGVAVYFQLHGDQQCIPCDKWTTVLGNVRAIGLTVEALRGLDRWGAKEMVDAAFAGFKALPATAGPSGSVRSWHDVLGVAPDAPPEVVKAAYRARAGKLHPDAGGSESDWLELQEAFQQSGVR